MKQFSLDEYLKNPSRKVVTREGRNVRIKGYDAKGSYPVIGLLDYGVSERPALFNENGRYWGEADSSLDLFFAPEKHEGWINLYSGRLHGSVFNTEEEAKSAVLVEDSYIATVKIEWEE